MRLIDPPKKIEVEDGDKTFEEIWNITPLDEEARITKEKIKIASDLHNLIMKQFFK
jgi:hypothetical protein